jgi:hypothetical protein
MRDDGKRDEQVAMPGCRRIPDPASRSCLQPETCFLLSTGTLISDIDGFDGYDDQ